MKSALTEIGKAVMNLIEEYGTAKESGYVRKPISYALYQTWKKWDKQEEPTEANIKDETQIIKDMFHRAIDNSYIADDVYPNLREELHKAIESVESEVNNE